MISSLNIEELKVKGFTYLNQIDESTLKEISRIISLSDNESTYQGDFKSGEKIANMLNLSIDNLEKIHEAVLVKKLGIKIFILF